MSQIEFIRVLFVNLNRVKLSSIGFVRLIFEPEIMFELDLSIKLTELEPN